MLKFLQKITPKKSNKIPLGYFQYKVGKALLKNKTNDSTFQQSKGNHHVKITYQ